MGKRDDKDFLARFILSTEWEGKSPGEKNVPPEPKVPPLPKTGGPTAPSEWTVRVAAKPVRRGTQCWLPVPAGYAEHGILLVGAWYLGEVMQVYPDRRIAPIYRYHECPDHFRWQVISAPSTRRRWVRRTGPAFALAISRGLYSFLRRRRREVTVALVTVPMNRPDALEFYRQELGRLATQYARWGICNHVERLYVAMERGAAALGKAPAVAPEMLREHRQIALGLLGRIKKVGKLRRGQVVGVLIASEIYIFLAAISYMLGEFAAAGQFSDKARALLHQDIAKGRPRMT